MKQCGSRRRGCESLCTGVLQVLQTKIQFLFLKCAFTAVGAFYATKAGHFLDFHGFHLQMWLFKGKLKTKRLHFLFLLFCQILNLGSFPFKSIFFSIFYKTKKQTLNRISGIPSASDVLRGEQRGFCCVRLLPEVWMEAASSPSF